MWTNEEETKFQNALDYYGNKKDDDEQGMLIAVLRETQEIFGCIPTEAQDKIAQAMGTKVSVIALLLKRIPSLSAQRFDHRIVVCTGPTLLCQGCNVCAKRSGKASWH